MKSTKEPCMVEILEEKFVWKGFLKVKQALLSFEKFDGSMTEPVLRESLIRKDAVTAILWDPDTFDILLVKQFRYPTYHKGPGWGLECVAGVMEEGETPLQSMEREIMEETGYKADQLNKVMEFYPSPGLSDERIILFSGIVHKKSDEQPSYGDKDMMEDIQLIWYTRTEIENFLSDNVAQKELQDAKTLIALYWWVNQLNTRF